MKHSLIGLAAGSALLIGCGIASAQDNTKIMDGNNPAPNPAPMAPAAHGAAAPSKIMDGNNPAPNPAPMAPAANGSHAASKIMDGNNPATNPAPTTSAAAAPKHVSHKKHSHAS